jgi:hypothetical protein
MQAILLPKHHFNMNAPREPEDISSYLIGNDAPPFKEENIGMVIDDNKSP